MDFEKTNTEELELEGFEDLDDFGAFDDFDDIDFEDMNKREPSLRDDAKAFTEAGLEGLSEGVSSAAISGLMPGGFSSDWDEIKDTGDFIKDLVVDSYRDVKSSVGRLLPETWQKKLGIEIESEESRNLSESQQREELINYELSGLFDDFKSRELREKELEAERLELEKGEVNRITDLNISHRQIELLTKISNNLNRGTNFLTEVSSNYYRKSLELKMRIHYTLLDSLRTNREFFSGFASQFSAIIKNTALPEYRKITASERMGEKLKDTLTSSIYQTAWSNNDFVSGIKSNINNAVKERVDSFRSFTDELMFAKSMVGDDESAWRNIAATTLGSEAGRYIGGKATNHLVDKYGDTVSNFEPLKWFGKTVGNISRYASTGVANLEEKNAKWLDDSYDEDGLKGIIGRTVFGTIDELFDLTRQGSRALNARPTDFTIFDKPAIFDQNVHRNITEGIPSYLGKILKNVSELNRNYAFVNRETLEDLKDALLEEGWAPVAEEEELYYNFQDRKLSTKEEYRDSIDRAVGERSGRNDGYSRMVNQAFKEADVVLKKAKGLEGRYSKKELNRTGARQELINYMIKMGRSPDIGKDWESLMVNPDDLDNLDPRIAREINKNPQLRRILKAFHELGDIDLGAKEREYMISRFNEMSSNTDSGYPIDDIKSLFRETSVIANGEVRNQINDDVAEMIAQAFTDYVDSTGKAIPSTQSGFKEALRRLESGHSELVKDDVVLFLNDLATIENRGVGSQKADITSLTGRVNNAISEKIFLSANTEGDNDADLFRSMKDLNPILDEEGKFDYRNVMLKTTRKQAPIVRASGDDLSFLDLDVMESDRTAKNIYESKLSKKFDKFGEDVSKTMKDQGKKWGVRFEKASTFVKDETLKRYGQVKKQLSGNLDQIKKAAGSMTEKTVKGSIRTIAHFVDMVIGDLEETLEELENTYTMGLKTIDGLRTEAEIQDDGGLDELDSARDAIEIQYQENRAEIERILDLLRELSNDLMRAHENFDISKVAETVVSIRNRVSKIVERITKHFK